MESFFFLSCSLKSAFWQQEASVVNQLLFFENSLLPLGSNTRSIDCYEDTMIRSSSSHLELNVGWVIATMFSVRSERVVKLLLWIRVVKWIRSKLKFMFERKCRWNLLVLLFYCKFGGPTGKLVTHDTDWSAGRSLSYKEKGDTVIPRSTELS